jgi:hypothetical protein
MPLKVKLLDKRAAGMMGDFFRVAEGVGGYIMNTTTTNKKSLRLGGLVAKILDDPENLQWVLDGGYYTPGARGMEKPDPASIQYAFDLWQANIIQQIEACNKATERLNGVVAAAATFIEENYPVKGE